MIVISMFPIIVFPKNSITVVLVMQAIIWAIGVNKFHNMRSYIIISAFLSYGYAYSLDIPESIKSQLDQTCLTDDIFGDCTVE